MISPERAMQFASLTLDIVYVVAAFGVTVIVPTPAAKSIVAKVLVVPSLNVTTNGAVPVKLTLKVAVPFAQIVVVPLNTAVGLGFTVIIADPTVKLDDLEHPTASCTLTKVYVVVALGFVFTLNATPLTTLFTVLFATPSLYTNVYGPVPDTLDLYVKLPVPPLHIVPPVKLPCGNGFTVTAVLALVTALQVPVTIA